MTNEPRGWSIAQQAKGIAFLALALAALLVPADRDGLVSVVGIGHVLLVVILFRSSADQRNVDRRLCRVTLGTLAILGVGEALGAWLCWRGSDSNVTCWFLVGGSFALAGIIAATREEPGDMMFVAQLMFHAIILLPLVAGATQAALTVGVTHEVARGAISDNGPLLRTGLVVASVLVPCLLATLAFAIGMSLAPARASRRTFWIALLAHEIVSLLILARWAAGLR